MYASTMTPYAFYPVDPAATLQRRPDSVFCVFSTHAHPPHASFSMGAPAYSGASFDSHHASYGTKAPVKARTSGGERLKALGVAAFFVLNALLLKKLPKHPSTTKWLSTDWKDWAKIALGIGAVGQVNKAFNWQPPAWLGAIETVALLNPLMLGRAGLAQLPGMAALVSGLVTATNWLNKHLEPLLNETLGIPHVLTRFALGVGSTAVGLTAYGPMARTGILGQSARASAEAGTSTVGAMTACGRCGGYHGLICMADIGEFFGAIGNWFHSKPHSSRRQK